MYSTWNWLRNGAFGRNQKQTFKQAVCTIEKAVRAYFQFLESKAKRYNVISLCDSTAIISPPGLGGKEL